VADPWLAGWFSSPVIDGDRLYQIDNSANIGAFDLDTGKQLWQKTLGTIQKASPVLADGKLYVGTESGKFYILKPSATGCEILSEQQLGTVALPEAVIASAAVRTDESILSVIRICIASGKKPKPQAEPHPDLSLGPIVPPPSATHVQVVPTELILKPGDKVNFRVRLFDAKGTLIREDHSATWVVGSIEGHCHQRRIRRRFGFACPVWFG